MYLYFVYGLQQVLQAQTLGFEKLKGKTTLIKNLI
jgi:hypothetical protein